MRSFGQYVVACLEAYGVDLVFGIPGVHTIGLYRGLAGSRIRHVTPRHEQGAGFMADGYARVSGRPGVCFIITGPGLTNIATAMAQAYGDSIPMLVISTVNSQGEMGSGEGHLHELPDQRQLMRQVTAFSHTIHDPAELPLVLARAFAIFRSARPRPVHVEIPVSMLDRPAEHLRLPPSPPELPPPDADPAAIEKIAGRCAVARQPLIIAGGGAVTAAEKIAALADALGAPVLMTINGRGILPDDHPLGVSISGASAAAQELLDQADLIIAIGTELGPTDFETVFKDRPIVGAKLIRVDVDPEQLVRPISPLMALLSDSGSFAAALLAALKHVGENDGETAAIRARTAMDAELSSTRKIQLAMLATIRDSLPGAVIVGDSNQPVYAGCAAFPAAAPRTFFSSATGYGTLGYGLPAALGAWLADRTHPVVTIMGDGGLQFSLPEMGSVVEQQAPLIMILWNNRGYGEIEKAMMEAGVEPLGVRIFTPDFNRLAVAYDWDYGQAKDCATLRSLLCSRQTISGRPMLIEINEAEFTR